MSTFKPDILIAPREIFTTDATQETDLGARVTTGDGRYFRYVLVGGTSLVAGNLIQAPAQVGANHLQLAATAAAANATSVTVTLGATAATANQYAGGWLIVTADSGSGGLKSTAYQIKSNPAASASATLTLTLADPLQNKITASGLIDLVLNPFTKVIQNPTTGTGTPVGAAVYAVTNAQYGWIQTTGVASLLNDAGGAITVGNTVVPSTSVAGAVKSATGTLPIIGIAVTTVTASATGAIMLVGLD